MDEVDKHAPWDVEMIVFGNKIDDTAEVQVTDEDIKKFEDLHKLKVYKCSAKTGENVETGFIEMARRLIKKFDLSSIED